MGVDKDAVYEEKTIPVFPGDKFYFITYGFMQPGAKPVLTDFDAAVAWLRRLATAKGRRDDCSALCIALQ